MVSKLPRMSVSTTQLKLRSCELHDWYSVRALCFWTQAVIFSGELDVCQDIPVMRVWEMREQPMLAMGLFVYICMYITSMGYRCGSGCDRQALLSQMPRACMHAFTMEGARLSTHCVCLRWIHYQERNAAEEQLSLKCACNLASHTYFALKQGSGRSSSWTGCESGFAGFYGFPHAWRPSVINHLS